MAEKSWLGGGDGRLRLCGIEPTAFFKRAGGRLSQAVDLSIANGPAQVTARLVVEMGDKQHEIRVGPITEGDRVYRVFLPDEDYVGPVRFELRARGRLCDVKTVAWRPQPKYTFYLVHNSHHDLGYTDLPSNVLAEHADFMVEALRCCKQTERRAPQLRFKYTVESAWSVLAFLKKYPQRRDELVKYIKRGQIEITALYTQATTDLCGHEEMVRLLYPAFELQRQHGIRITSAELNDIPGVAWGLASVLAGAGVRYFSVGLPDYYGIDFADAGGLQAEGIHFFWDEPKVIDRELPGGFRWQGPDGAEVLFWFTRYGAGGLPMWDVQQLETVLTREFQVLRDKGYPYDLVKYQVKSAWGRDNSPPTLRFSEIARQWQRTWAYPKLVTATNEEFFLAWQRKYYAGLKVFKGALPDTDYVIGAIGMAPETAVNRRARDELAAAEKFAALAQAWGGGVDLSETVRRGYENVLFYDEHVWGIGHTYGPAQEASKAEKAVFAHRAAALSQDVLVKATNQLADLVQVAEDGCHIVLYNPLSWQRSEAAFCPLIQPRPCGRPLHWQEGKWQPDYALGRAVHDLPNDLLTEPYALVDAATGREVPFELVDGGGFDGAGREQAEQSVFHQQRAGHGKTLVFVAEGVPSCGYQSYRLVRRAPRRGRVGVKAGRDRIENEYYRITFDPQSGVVAGIYDKKLKRQLLDGKAQHCFNQMVMREAGSGREHWAQRSRVEQVTAGQVAATLTISGELKGCPQVVQTVRLYAGVRRIEVFNRVLRDSTGMLELYTAFPFGVAKARYALESGNAVVRPLQDQLPGSNSHYYAMQHWAHVYGAGLGVTMAAVDAPLVEFGGLRACKLSQAHHSVTPKGFAEPFAGADEFGKGHLYSFLMCNNFRTNFQNTQVGQSGFRYAFTSGRHDWRAAQTWRFGWEAANPLIPVYLAGKQAGSLPGSFSFCQVQPGHVLLTALKRAEDGDGLVLRLMETKGTACQAEITLPGLAITHCALVDLVEQNPRPVRHTKHAVKIPLKPFGLATVRTRCAVK